MPADPRDTVALAYLHPAGPATIVHSFHQSFFELVAWDARAHGRLRGRFYAMANGPDISEGRNAVVQQFLQDDDDWLFWVDDDMGFSGDALERLLAVADPVEAPIVGGLCFAQRHVRPDLRNGFRCKPAVTIYDWVPDRGFKGRAEYPINRVVRCGATGSAFIVIHRSVVKAVWDMSDGKPYDRVPGLDGKLMGEDISFCARAGSLGFPVHVHTGVRTTHYKNLWLAEEDFWSAYQPDPADQPTAVVVPVLNRPQNAEPFMRSLRASTGLATAYAVCSEPADADAWAKAGANVVWTPDRTTFAKKVNDGYRASGEPWLFLCGDDVRFHPGWLDHAQSVARLENARVVGTNDLANSRVLAGEHGTHLLVDRAYVDEQGASWDGPGVVAHEGYRHWYVDDELVSAAKQRDVWSMALGSIVEHLHPLAGKAEPDATYELGQRFAAVDRDLYVARAKRNGLKVQVV